MVTTNEHETFTIHRPEASPEQRDAQKLTILATLSLVLVSLTISLFILGCIFFMVQAIVAAPHTHGHSESEVRAFASNIKNFWEIILGASLIGLGFLLMFAKFLVMLAELPVLKKFGESSQVRAIFNRYQTWKNWTIALWLSFNILLGTLTDSNLVQFCRDLRARLGSLNKVK